MIVILERVRSGCFCCSRTSGALAAWLILPLIFATCFEVFSRYVLARPTIWSYDIGYMLTGAHFLLGAAFTLLEDEHVRIDIFYSRFSERGKAAVNLATHLLIILPVCFLLSSTLWDYALQAFLSSERAGTSAWNPLVWPFRFVFFAGFLLLLVQSIGNMLDCTLLFFKNSTEGE